MVRLACTRGMTNNPDDCIFPNVDLNTEFGGKIKTKTRLPLMTGALGSTFIAAKYWDSFAVGCALIGIPIVIGENVVGVDRESTITGGRIKKSPELDRRIDIYLRYFDGYGAIIVQMNVEDTRNGVAEYVAEKYGNKCIIELKWGQGAKNIGGEIQVTSLDYALFLKERGYIVDPNPALPEVQEAFAKGAIKSFARHSRLGGTNLDTVALVREDFMKIRRLSAQSRIQSHLPENRLLRHGRAGHGHQVRFRCQPRSADHRRFRRRHRHEPLEHDAELGRAVHQSPCQGL